jgi:N-acetylmuramate 1-kinase
MDFEDTARSAVAKAVSTPTGSARVIKLKGDASNRSYYRVATTPPYVVMVMPTAAKTSEEATKGPAPAELPFINVHRYLARLGVRVPRIYAHDEAAGTLVLEDLGDLTFEAALIAGDDRGRLYGDAIDTLARLRVRAEAEVDPACIAFGRGFDEELYDWELHHFREYGLEARYGASLKAGERGRLDAIFRQIAAHLAREPRGFTHRDYQSRNLMIRNGEMVVIDFQDALLGPRQYDLVALLRDSYVVLDQDFVAANIARYRASLAQAGGPELEPEEFRRTFDLLTVQRKLKDAGRFEFIARVKGNPGFLPHVPASLGYAKEALQRLPELTELRDILARHVPELR